MKDLDSIYSGSIEQKDFNFGDGRIAYSRIFGMQPFNRVLPLLSEDEDIVHPWLAKMHRDGVRPPPRPIDCFFVRDAVLVGHDTILIDEDQILDLSFLPKYRINIRRNMSGERRLQELMRARKIVEVPCVPLAADGNVYGHFLIEALPRLHLAVKYLRDRLPDFKILVIKTLPGWTRRILAQEYGIGPDDLIEYDPTQEIVLMKQMIWPSLFVFEDFFHPAFNFVVSELVRGSGDRDSAAKRLFCSRVFFNNPVMQDRAIENELELARIAVTEFGFTVVSPETYTWRQQIATFASATHIVGRFGSALHNAIFSPPTTRVGILRFFNLVQTGISALRQQRIGYLTDSSAASNIIIPPERFRRLLDMM